MRASTAHTSSRAGVLHQAGFCEPAETGQGDVFANLLQLFDMARQNKRLRFRVRPLTLGLSILALAVVLWGLQYRVSLYHPHPGSSARLNIAKLWIAPRAAFTLSVVTKATAQPSPDSHNLVMQCLRPSQPGDRDPMSSSTLMAGVRYRGRPGIPRSPPA